MQKWHCYALQESFPALALQVVVKQTFEIIEIKKCLAFFCIESINGIPHIAMFI